MSPAATEPDVTPRRLFARDLLIVAAVAAVVFLPRLGSAYLFDEDEPKNAVCGREMYLRGDWVVPTFNHGLRTDKPIMIYWLMLASFATFGVNEFAARLPCALCALGTCLLTYRLGRDLFDRRTGVLAGVALASTLMFTVAGRACTPDSILIFFQTLGVTVFVAAVAARRGGRFAGRGDAAQTPMWVPSLGGAVLMFAALGLAVLAKGPVGVVLPCAAIGLFLLIRGTLHDGLPAAAAGWSRGRRAVAWAASVASPTRFAVTCWRMRVPLGALVVLAVAAPWYTAVGIQTDGAWLRGFLGTHNVGRFTAPMENHSGPFFYYLPVVLAGFFPWSVFLPAAVVRAARRCGADEPAAASRQLLLCWAGVYLVVFSIARTKLPNYILPAYVPLALLTATAVREWAAAGAASRRLFRVGIGSLGVAGLGIAVGLAVAAHYFLPGKLWIAAVGLIPLFGAVIAWQFTRNRITPAAVRAVACAAVLFVVAMASGVAPSLSGMQESVRLGQVAAQRGGPVSTFGFSNPNVVFYGGGRTALLQNPADVAAALAEPQASVLLTADRLPDVLPELPAGTRVLARMPRFLRGGETVLLGRPNTVAQQPSRRIR